MPATTPAQTTWSTFVRDIWEQDVYVGPQPANARLEITPDTAFATVCECVTAERIAEGVTARFFVDQAQVVGDLDALWPKVEDGSFEGYDRRMAQQLGGQPYMLVVNHIQLVNRALWHDARSFVRGLYDALDRVPAGHADLDLIIGRYDRTPHGIHTDPLSNFMFAVVGEKDMLTWPPQASVPLSTRAYDDVRDSARVLTSSGDNLIYWPSAQWHVGESHSEFSASLSLGVYFDESDPLIPILGEIADTAREGGTFDPIPRLYRRSTSLPDNVAAALSAARAASASPDLEPMLEEMWLRFRSADGFIHFPEPAAGGAEVDPGRLLEPCEFDVIVETLISGETCIACNGQALRVPEMSDQMRSGLDRMLDGSPFTLNEILDSIEREDEQDDLFRIAQNLWLWGAFESANRR